MPDLNKVFEKVEKSLKKDPSCGIKTAGDITISSSIPYGIPTGIPELEVAIGRPGLPSGRICEFYGFERSGKTTAALQVLAHAQRMGGGGMYIDTEFTWDESRAVNLGVDPDVNFRVGEATTLEGVFREIDSTLDALIEEGYNKPFVIIVDSITGVDSEVNKDNKFGAEPRLGQDARVIRRGLRTINHKIVKSKACLIFINHSIQNIGASPFAPQSTSSGGRALKLFSTFRLQFSQGKDLTFERDDIKYKYGQVTFLKIEKLKSAKLNFTKFEVNLLDDGGFDTAGSLFRAGVLSGWIEKVNQKTYKFGEHEFPAGDWPAIVEQFGSREKAYDTWMKWALENEKLSLWRNWNGV